MLTLEVHFLTGRYAATAYNDRSVAEWPPHPARLFSALVDALNADGSIDADEAQALDDLAALPPPLVLASDAYFRRVMTSFVPVNDAAVTDAATLAKREEKLRAARAALGDLAPDALPKVRAKAEKALGAARADLAARSREEASAGKSLPKDNPGPKVLPWGRVKQPRTFPVALPHRDHAAFVWEDGELDQAALQRVADRVVRLGHSSSFVRVHVATVGVVSDPELKTWRPDHDGSVVMRVPIGGQRQALDGEYGRHGGDLPGRVMPARHVRYAEAEVGRAEGTTRRSAGRWIVYHLQGQELPPAHAAVAVADAMRAAVLRHVEGSVPPELSGLEEGQPTTRPHIAFVSLPFVGHRHADGRIRGVALSLPEGVDPGADGALLRALGRWERAGEPDERVIGFDIRGRAVTASRVIDPEDTLSTLQRWRWATPSRRWVSVTPIALDGECSPLNHPSPGTRREAHRTAAKLVRRSIVRAVCPPPEVTLEPGDIDLTLVFDAPVAGGPHLRAFPPYRRPGHPRPRRLVHAVFELPFPVRGPLLLGSGRHFGLGLCVPAEPAGEPR